MPASIQAPTDQMWFVEQQLACRFAHVLYVARPVDRVAVFEVFAGGFTEQLCDRDENFFASLSGDAGRGTDQIGGPKGAV